MLHDWPLNAMTLPWVAPVATTVFIGDMIFGG